MKSIVSTFLLALVFCKVAWCQHLPLSGRISELNSRTRTGAIRYVEGAAVSAPHATPQASDAKGRFSLVFASQAEGSHHPLTVEKPGYEVANARELEAVTIPRLDTLRVIVADPAYLAQEQAALLDIQTKALTRELDALISKLRSDSATSRKTLAELKERFQQDFLHYGEAEEFLQQRLASVKERLPERAAELARVNLDFASAQYTKWLACLRRGALDSVIDGIDEELLAIEAISALEEFAEIRSSYHTNQILHETTIDVINEVISNYILKANALELQFRFKEAASVAEKGLGLITRKNGGVESLEAANIMDRIAALLIGNGNYADANSWHREALETYLKVGISDSLIIAIAYNNISTSYLWLRDFKNALYFQEKAIRIRENLMAPNHPLLGESYNTLATIFLEVDSLEKALYNQEKSISILIQSYDSTRLQIASAYNNLAIIFTALGQFSKAKEAIQRAIYLHEKAGRKNTPELASYYNSLAIIYSNQNDFTEGIVCANRSIQILKELFDQGHPHLSNSHNVLADLLIKSGDLVRAKEAAIISISNSRKTLPETHEFQPLALIKLAIIEKLMGNHEAEIDLRHEAITLLTAKEAPNEKLIGETYGGIILALENAGKPIEALDVNKIAISIINRIAPSESIEKAGLYHNAGRLFYKNALFDSSIVYESQAMKNLISCKNPPAALLENIEVSLASVHYQKSKQLIIQKSYANALFHLDTCISYFSGSTNIWIAKGVCEYHLGRYKAAIQSYEKVHEIAPDSSRYYFYNTSLAYSKLRQFGKAKECLNELERAYPQSFWVEIGWMLYHSQKRKHPAALQNLEKAIDLGFKDRAWLDNESAFDQLRDDPRFKSLVSRMP